MRKPGTNARIDDGHDDARSGRAAREERLDVHDRVIEAITAWIRRDVIREAGGSDALDRDGFNPELLAAPDQPWHGPVHVPVPRSRDDGILGDRLHAGDCA